MSEPPVRVGHEHWKQSRERPQHQGREEVGDVAGQGDVQVVLQVFRIEKRERLKEGDDVGWTREEEEDNEENDVTDPDLDQSEVPGPTQVFPDDVLGWRSKPDIPGARSQQVVQARCGWT